MAKKFLWWTLVGGIALVAGCAVQPTGQRFMVQTMPKVCPDAAGLCVIKVGIDKCSTLPNACDLYVEYDLVQFPPNKRGPIKWVLQDAGFEFPDDGITFADGGKVFNNCQPVESRRAFQCENTHPQSGTEAFYKYTVKVTGSTKTYPLDPWIVNE